MTNKCSNQTAAKPTPSEIAKVKAEFSRQYQMFNEQISHLDCGLHMAKHIKPEAALLADKINKLANFLRMHDPKFPSSWVPV